MDNKTRSLVVANEGYRDNPYNDSLGIKTVGYGFNMQDPVTASLLPADVRVGKRGLSKTEADAILKQRVNMAITDAGNFVGSDTYGSLAQPRRAALVDMAYQMGGPRLSGFKGVKAGLTGGDYGSAADEVLNSGYAKQTPERAYRNAFTILTGQPYDASVVQSYQKANGLTPDGVVGPKTWRVLRQKLGRSK